MRKKETKRYLFNQAGYIESCEWSLLCNFHHHSVTSRKGRAEFPRLHQQREVPLQRGEREERGMGSEGIVTLLTVCVCFLFHCDIQLLCFYQATPLIYTHFYLCLCTGWCPRPSGLEWHDPLWPLLLLFHLCSGVFCWHSQTISLSNMWRLVSTLQFSGKMRAQLYCTRKEEMIVNQTGFVSSHIFIYCRSTVHCDTEKRSLKLEEKAYTVYTVYTLLQSSTDIILKWATVFQQAEKKHDLFQHRNLILTLSLNFRSVI